MKPKFFNWVIDNIKSMYKRRELKKKLKTRTELDKTSKYRKMKFLDDKRKK